MWLHLLHLQGTVGIPFAHTSFVAHHSQSLIGSQLGRPYLESDGSFVAGGRYLLQVWCGKGSTVQWCIFGDVYPSVVAVAKGSAHIR